MGWGADVKTGLGRDSGGVENGFSAARATAWRAEPALPGPHACLQSDRLTADVFLSRNAGSGVQRHEAHQEGGSALSSPAGPELSPPEPPWLASPSET